MARYRLSGGVADATAYTEEAVAITNTKICPTCGIEKPATTEYFMRRPSIPSGFKSRCKACEKEYRQENKERMADYQKQYRTNNKDRLAKTSKLYREKNKERIAESKKQYYEQCYRERNLEYQKKYREINREKLNEYDRHRNKYQAGRAESTASAIKRWQKNNTGKTRIFGQRRRAKQKKVLSTLTEWQWEQAKEYFNQKCAYCGKKRKLHQEHFIPLASQGEYTVSNILPSCQKCNSRKSTKDFFEWYPRQPFYSATREKKILKHLGYISKDEQQMSLLATGAWEGGVGGGN